MQFELACLAVLGGHEQAGGSHRLQVLLVDGGLAQITLKEGDCQEESGLVDGEVPADAQQPVHQLPDHPVGHSALVGQSR